MSGLKNSIITLIFLIFLSFIQGCSSPVKYSRTTAAIPQNDIADIARAQIGVKYRYGGRHPATGFDCSGLVFYSHKQAGISVPRTSTQQFARTKPVSKQALKRGDMVFFMINRYKISHVGIYLGNRRFVHAPSSGKQVSIESLDNPYWKKRFVRGGRAF